MSAARQISADEARRIGDALGIAWSQVDLEQFRRGLEVELEADYYTRLDKLEEEATRQEKTNAIRSKKEDFTPFL